MSYEVSIFGIDVTLKPVAFTLPIGNGWDVYWYGIIIAFGFVLALIYAYTNYKRFNLDVDRMLDVVLITVPIAILCARAYYVIFDGVKLESVGDFFGFGNSSGFQGLAIYGGVIGAFVTGFLMCKLRKVKFTDMFDLAALGFLIGQGVGRWGNFVNQEAFGSLTKAPGMMSSEVMNYIYANPANFGLGDKTHNEIYNYINDNNLSVHPCFFYESLWCILGFVLIHFLSKKRKFSGEVFLMYLAWYGFGRAIIETLRTDSLMMGPFKVSLVLGILLCVASIIAIIVIRKKIANNALPYEGILTEEATETVETEVEETVETEEVNEPEKEEVEDNVQTD